MVETDVHYPTDINLLWDALRKLIIWSARVSQRYGLSGWGKSGYNLRQVKRLFRRVQPLKPATATTEKPQPQRAKALRQAYRAYLELGRTLVQRTEVTLAQLPAGETVLEREDLEAFVLHAYRQLAQIERRVLQGETIAHGDKVFSLFEQHTAWISKGKAGVPVELGLPVCILEDEWGFILHHRILHGESDAAVAVPMVKETQQRFPTLKRCSFARGFYTPDNRTQLRSLLEVSTLPSRGPPAKTEAAWEAAEAFVAARRQHAAVESAINALEVHGLDRCLDHGLDGFRRYVALAVVARNIQQLGAWLYYQAARARQRQTRRRLLRAA